MYNQRHFQSKSYLRTILWRMLLTVGGVRFHISCSWKNEVRSAMMGTCELSHTITLLDTLDPANHHHPYQMILSLLLHSIFRIIHLQKKELHGLILTGSSWQFSSWAICHHVYILLNYLCMLNAFSLFLVSSNCEFLPTTLSWVLSSSLPLGRRIACLVQQLSAQCSPSKHF